MLNENKKEREGENLDDEENMKLNPENKIDQDDSGFAHNRL